MRRIPSPLLLLLPTLLFSLFLFGCQGRALPKNIPGELPELMARIYEAAPEQVWPERETYPIRPDNMAYFLGVENLPMAEGLASEAVSPAVPHSVCLIRLSDSTAAAGVQEQLRRSVDPYKWIYTGVADRDVIVDSYGDLLILILANHGEALHQGFLSLSGN